MKIHLFFLQVLTVIFAIFLAFVIYFASLPFRVLDLFRKPKQSFVIKLYRKDGEATEFWETCSVGDNGFEVHWGKLGEHGQSKTVPPEDQDKVLAEIETWKAAGFAPIDHDDLYQMEIICQIDGRGGGSAVDRRHALEEHLGELLGLTGLGHVDGGSIGSGTMEVFAYVVDPDIATRIVTENLKDSEWRDFDEITIHPPYNQWSDEDKGLTGQPA